MIVEGEGLQHRGRPARPSEAEATMAYLKLHQAEGGYRIHLDDGSVEPDLYVSYHQAASRVRWLNLTVPAPAAVPAPHRRRSLLHLRSR